MHLPSLKNLGKTVLLLVSVFVARVARQAQRPVILMYHSYDTTGWRYGVAPVQIKWQLQYLRQHRTITPLADIVDYVAGNREITDDAVAITIDDGYEDTYSIFFPLAQYYKIPFTLFLTTDLSQKPNLGNLTRPTWEQIKEMHDSGLMTIGLHGHTHMHFTTALNDGVARQEINDSIAIIEQELGVKPRISAYPSGQYNKAVVTYLQNIDCIEAAAATHSGGVAVGDDLYALRRVEVNRSMNQVQFRLRLTPALEIYNRCVVQIKSIYHRL